MTEDKPEYSRAIFANLLRRVSALEMAARRVLLASGGVRARSAVRCDGWWQAIDDLKHAIQDVELSLPDPHFYRRESPAESSVSDE